MNTATLTPEEVSAFIPTPFDPYSLNRLAAFSGWPEASLRRATNADEKIREILDMRDFRSAVIAARALKAGHDPSCIRAINALPHISSGMWLTTTMGSAKITSSMVKAIVWIEDHPADMWTLSCLGTLSLGIQGY
jgi:hypothetical protein